MPTATRDFHSPHAPERDFLPDFRDPKVLLMLLLLAQSVAIILSLILAVSWQEWWIDVAMCSLFVHWVALPGAFALHQLKKVSWNISATWFGIIAWLLIMLITLLVTTAALLFNLVDQKLIASTGHIQFHLRTLAISGTLSAITLRYLYINWQLRRNIEHAARSHLQALQMRMRPHFLFNGLNTIASLISQHPDKAERMIEDLADLIRGSLDDTHYMIAWREELRLCQRYLDMEKQRLGDRLHVQWQIDTLETDDEDIQVPRFILQPLLENAIYHGIQMLDEGGTVSVHGTYTDEDIELRIKNPRYPDRSTAGSGYHLAQENVRQQLQAVYASRFRFEITETDDFYQIFLRLPKKPPPDSLDMKPLLSRSDTLRHNEDTDRR